MARFTTRVRRLRAQALREADAFLITHLPNLCYLTGFSGTTGVLALTASETALFVPPLYAQQARREAPSARIHAGSDPLAAAAVWLARRRPARVAYEKSHLTLSQFETLRQALGPRVELVGLTNAVEQGRALKDKTEVASIRASVQVTARVFEQVLPLVRPGVRELDLAAEIEYRMKQQGARGPAFETIVASGPRAALPHGRATGKRLAKNELVVFDLGAILSGYHSDMTRTVYLGRPSARVKRTYRAVRDALERAREAVAAGVPASRVDRAARSVLTRRGLGRCFVHGTGHGLGLEIHEEPRVGRGADAPLAAGNVITLEPGAYIPGWGGVRIEDVVVVRRRGAETLTPLSTELLCL
jgi:Xaa-Pro aminopeptidase